MLLRRTESLHVRGRCGSSSVTGPVGARILRGRCVPVLPIPCSLSNKRPPTATHAAPPGSPAFRPGSKDFGLPRSRSMHRSDGDRSRARRSASSPRRCCVVYGRARRRVPGWSLRSARARCSCLRFQPVRWHNLGQSSPATRCPRWSACYALVSSLIPPSQALSPWRRQSR